jgi:hypothetical protein
MFDAASAAAAANDFLGELTPGAREQAAATTAAAAAAASALNGWYVVPQGGGGVGAHADHALPQQPHAPSAFSAGYGAHAPLSAPPFAPPPAPPSAPPPVGTALLALGGGAAWSGALCKQGQRVVRIALRPLRLPHGGALADPSAVPWPASGVLDDTKRASVTDLLAGTHGPLTPALAPLFYAEALPDAAAGAASAAAAAAAAAAALERYTSALLNAHAEAGGRAARAVVLSLPGGRYELLLLPATPAVCSEWAVPPDVARDASGAARLLAALVPSRWAGRLETVTEAGEVTSSAYALSRPCDSSGAAVALPDAVQLTRRTAAARAVTAQGALEHAAFAFAGRTPADATAMARMVARYSEKGRVACARLPLPALPPGAAPPSPTAPQPQADNLWLFPSQDLTRFLCLGQRDATSRSLLYLT